MKTNRASHMHRVASDRLFRFLLPALLCPALAQAWLAPYEYRKELPVNAGSGAGTDYQVRILVGESSGAVGAHLHVEGNAGAFPDDIRFTDDDGDTALGHWFERVTGTAPNRVATFWVKVNDSLDSNQSIYVYYGEPGGASGSDGTATFAFFDGFDGSSIDTGKWTIDDATGLSVAAGELKGANTTGRIRSLATFSSGVIQEVKVRTITRPTNGYMALGFRMSGTDSFGWLCHPASDYIRNNGTWTLIGASTLLNTNLLGYLAVKSGTQVDFFVFDYTTGATNKNYASQNNPVSSEYVSLGRRYDDLNQNLPYEAYWDWVRVRKYATTVPTPGTPGDEENAVVGQPRIDNEPSAGVTATSATLNGYLVSTGAAPTTVWIFWGEQDGLAGGTWSQSATWPEGFWGEGSHPVTNINSLTQDRYYFYSYYATNASGSDWPSTSRGFMTGELTLSTPDPSCGTSLADTATVVVSRALTCTGGATVVYYTSSGDATNGTDYTATPASGSLVLQPGESSVSITITPKAPWNYGSAKNFSVTLLSGAQYLVGTASNAVCTLETMPRLPYYWDGADWKAWDALDNGGLSWWRWGATNAAFSSVLPGNGDTCYHRKAGFVMVKGADLGAPGQYAVIRLGNDARLRAQGTGRYNPLIIEATGAGLGDTANGDEVCYNPITLEGRMDVRKGRTMSIFSYVSGTGSVAYLGSCTIYGYTNSYTGGTRINPSVQVTTASGVWPNDQDGYFGTGPVDMSNGSEHWVGKSPWNASFARFLNSRSSYYGSAGGTNRVAQSDSKDWDIYGSNVTWRPGPRDGSGVGTLRAYNIANLKGCGDSTNGYPRLLIGMKLGGVCDKLLLTTNAFKPQFKPNGNLRLVLDNADAGQPAGAWGGQGGTKYTIIELDGPVSDHAVTGRFRNDYQVVDATTDKILFDEGGFRSAHITYQGDAATQATSGGNDILLWNLVPADAHPGTLILIQ